MQNILEYLGLTIYIYVMLLLEAAIVNDTIVPYIYNIYIYAEFCSNEF